jgi:transcriptional regulator with XRE-family HTH domain
MRETTLTEWREELKLTVEELAGELGVTPAEIAAWERDEASCPYQKMLELAMECLSAERALNNPALDRAIAESEERFDKFMAESAEQERKSAAFWAEHNKWMDEQAMKEGA